MISVAALRMQQFGVQFYQASLTAKDIDKLVRFEVLSYGEQGRRVGRARQRAAVEGPLGLPRAPHRLDREGVPAPDHPQEDRRARRLLRTVPPGARSAVDSRRRHHFLRRAAEVRADRRANRRSASSRCPSAKGFSARSTASTACSRCTPASSSSAARPSPCPRSSSTGSPKITSSRCSSRSTRSTRG